MSLETSEKQVISKRRVTDHGEVFTNQREVKAMLELVKHETERIESKFLEPACGTGNFLAEVLERKLQVVKMRYGKVQLEYERNAVLAISSIYGIDILEDNVQECRCPEPIIFSEWSFVNGSMIKRLDFSFKELLHHESMMDLPLFADTGEDVFIPTPIEDFPVVHFLRAGDDAKKY